MDLSEPERVWIGDDHRFHSLKGSFAPVPEPDACPGAVSASGIWHRVSGILASMDPKHLSEGEPVPDDLTPYWNETIDMYRRLVESRPQHRCVCWLMEHIISKGYSKHLFPGTSMYRLLVSLPKNGLVNYRPTLGVNYDELHQHVSLSLVGTDSQTWETTCQPSEVIDTFEHFIEEHPDWSDAVCQHHMVFLNFKDPTRANGPQTSRIGDVLWKGIGAALSIIVPRQNPDFDKLLSDVDHWMVEYDTCQEETIREIGCDNNGKAIVAMPVGRNYGYWTDNQLKLADYERFSPIAITAQDFDAAWQRFILEWNRH